MLKAIIFDFDGVIADSMNVGFMTTNNILKIFGKPPATIDEFRQEMGADWKKFYKNRGVPEDMIEREPELFRKEIEVLKKDIEMFDGINIVIHELIKKYKLGIVSSNHWEHIVEFLQKFGVHGHFDSIIGHMDGALKPDVRPLMMCLDELNVKPEEACMIGDTIDDITMARRAGIAKIIAVSYGYDYLHKLKGADEIVHSPGEILGAIRKFGE
ncbi:MAG TPA: HAD family hydrolase [archaeon]|nr:HAD family hydrolase [archaeon]